MSQKVCNPKNVRFVLTTYKSTQPWNLFRAQITEIISSLTNKKEGFSNLIKLGLESLMKSERSLHNERTHDVSNGYRDRKVYSSGKVFEIQVPRSREKNFYPMLLGVLKDQEAEVHRLVCSLYTEGLTTSQVGRISESFYGKHYSKSQVSRLLDGAREDVDLWLSRKLDPRYPIIYIDATYVRTVHLKRNIINKIKPIHKKEIGADLRQIFLPDREDVSCDSVFDDFQKFITRWQGSYPGLKSYKNERYRLYFTYFKYEKSIRTMILYHQLD